MDVPAGWRGVVTSIGDQPIHARAIDPVNEHNVVHVVRRTEINLQPVVRDVQGRACCAIIFDRSALLRFIRHRETLQYLRYGIDDSRTRGCSSRK